MILQILLLTLLSNAFAAPSQGNLCKQFHSLIEDIVTSKVQQMMQDNVKTVSNNEANSQDNVEKNENQDNLDSVQPSNIDENASSVDEQGNNESGLESNKSKRLVGEIVAEALLEGNEQFDSIDQKEVDTEIEKSSDEVDKVLTKKLVEGLSQTESQPADKQSDGNDANSDDSTVDGSLETVESPVITDDKENDENTTVPPSVVFESSSTDLLRVSPTSDRDGSENQASDEQEDNGNAFMVNDALDHLQNEQQRNNDDEKSFHNEENLNGAVSHSPAEVNTDESHSGDESSATASVVAADDSSKLKLPDAAVNEVIDAGQPMTDESEHAVRKRHTEEHSSSYNAADGIQLDSIITESQTIHPAVGATDGTQKDVPRRFFSNFGPPIPVQIG